MIWLYVDFILNQCFIVFGKNPTILDFKNEDFFLFTSCQKKSDIDFF